MVLRLFISSTSLQTTVPLNCLSYGSDKLSLIILVLAIKIWTLVSSLAWIDEISFDNLTMHLYVVGIDLCIVITKALWASPLLQFSFHKTVGSDF